MSKLTDEQIEQKLADLDGWSLEDGQLHREFEFADFNEAFGFMSRVALVAEKINHHPNWYNAYKTVDVKLRTHDADAITDKDFQLAAKMNEFAG